MVSWSAVIEEYPFKIMLYFLQGILYLFKWQFHALRFLTETSPFLKGIVVYNCIYIWKGSLLHANLNHYTILSHTLSQGRLCVFHNGCYTLLKGIVCINVYIYFFHIIQWIMLFENDIVLSKWFFSMEYSITPLFKSIFHEAIKYCLKGMPFFEKR